MIDAIQLSERDRMELIYNFMMSSPYELYPEFISNGSKFTLFTDKPFLSDSNLKVKKFYFTSKKQ